MRNKSDTPKRLFQALLTEARRIHEDALFCCAGHSQEARYWDALQLWLGIPATIAAAVAGVTTLINPANTAGGSGINTNIIAGVLSLMVAVLTGLNTFLDPKGQAVKHYAAVNAYTALLNDARFFYSIDCLEDGDLARLQADLRKLSGRLNELPGQTPLISKRAARLGQKSIQAGTYEYQVDKVRATQA